MIFGVLKFWSKIKRFLRSANLFKNLNFGQKSFPILVKKSRNFGQKYFTILVKNIKRFSQKYFKSLVNNFGKKSIKVLLKNLEI